MRSLGERATLVALKELALGVREEPDGSNTGLRIRDYLAGCRRKGTERELGLTVSNWCMAFVSFCMVHAREEDEKLPHGYRAGVVEAVADAMDPQDVWSGRWHPVRSVRNGEWFPEMGDLAVFDRSKPKSQDPKGTTAWWRHVNRVIAEDKGVFAAVGGNQENTITISAHRIDEPKLLGFIQYPSPYTALYIEGASQIVPITDEERKSVENMVAMWNDDYVRKYVWGVKD
ncbi:MAG: hypothetical protein ACYTEQ_05180 [Planctomycetota bacterium]|jgi:hypothetical protein